MIPADHINGEGGNLYDLEGLDTAYLGNRWQMIQLASERS